MFVIRKYLLFFFLFWFCIRFLYVMINCMLVNKRIKSFGKKICNLPNLLEQKEDLFRIIFISCIITIVCTFFVAFLTRERLLFVFTLLPLTMITRSLLIKKISASNGIYEEGIVLGMFIKYTKIQTYKKNDSEEILLFLKNGRSFKIKTKENINEIEIYLRKKMIRPFESY